MVVVVLAESAKLLDPAVRFNERLLSYNCIRRASWKLLELVDELVRFSTTEKSQTFIKMRYFVVYFYSLL